MRSGLLILAAMACVLVSCGDKPATDRGDQPSVASTTNAAAVTSPVEFESLKGKWARADGDYLLEVTSVAADGKMQAGYFNPNPIHVSKALAIKEAGGTRVFIELQDVGYPGCTYSLNLDTATSQLHGQYFQAAQQQTYDVVFAKVRE